MLFWKLYQAVKERRRVGVATMYFFFGLGSVERLKKRKREVRYSVPYVHHMDTLAVEALEEAEEYSNSG